MRADGEDCNCLYNEWEGQTKYYVLQEWVFASAMFLVLPVPTALLTDNAACDVALGLGACKLHRQKIVKPQIATDEISHSTEDTKRNDLLTIYVLVKTSISSQMI